MRVDLKTCDITTLPFTLNANGNCIGLIETLFADDVLVDIPSRSLIINLILWDPNYRLGIRPKSSDYITFKSITPSEITKHESRLYERAVTERPDIPHAFITLLYAYCVDKLSNYTQEYTANFMPSIDIIGLSKVMKHPSIRAILERPIVTNMGTKVAEQSLKSSAEELITALRTVKGEDNCLYPYMRAQTLKNNQIPQFLHAYGTRSDIDDTMMKYVITDSSIGGLSNVFAYAVEYLSAKKSIYFSHSVIRDTQYFARKLRLVCSSFVSIKPGHCGSDGYLVYTIPPEFGDYYIDRIIIENNKRIILNEKNIEKYTGRPVQLVSQFMCNDLNGLCEHCAGYGRDRLIKYMPADIHIGILAEIQLASMLSQQVLSTKHLVIGVTMVYVLADMARRYMYQSGNSIYFKDEVKDSFEGLYIRIPRRSLQQIADLNCRSMPNVESFSSIAYFDFVREGEVVERIDLNSGTFIPYFSKDMIKFLKSKMSSITVTQSYIDIPLSGYDPKIPMLDFTSMNDDIGMFVKQVRAFLSKEISRFTTVQTAIDNFSRLIYKKAKINSFYLETVLRAHLITDTNDYRTPRVIDPSHVHFGKLADVITERTVTGKFAFERMADYIKKPGTPLVPKPVGLYGPAFGFLS